MPFSKLLNILFEFGMSENIGFDSKLLILTYLREQKINYQRFFTGVFT